MNPVIARLLLAKLLEEKAADPNPNPQRETKILQLERLLNRA